MRGNGYPSGVTSGFERAPMSPWSTLVFQDDTCVWIDLLGTVCWTRPEENESGETGFGPEIRAAPDNYKAYVQRLVASREAGDPDGAP